MKKVNIVKKNIEFNNIIKNGHKFYNDIVNVYVIKNEYDYNRYGISISKKIGNAVTRNKFKRRIKDIIDRYEFKICGYDLILVSRIKLKDCDYKYIMDSLFRLFNMIGDKYEKE